MRIVIVCGEVPGDLNVFRGVSERLAESLEDLGHTVDIVQWLRGLRRYDVVLLQYNPFLYGRRGFAPWLVAELYNVRRGPNRPRIVLYVHEPFVPMRGWRWTLMGLWQRAQLFALIVVADLTLVSIQRWTELLARWPTRRRVVHFPVGSSLPAAAARRGGNGQRFVVATLAAGDPSRRSDLVHAALASLADEGHPVELLVLGAGAQAPGDVPQGVTVRVPGPLDYRTLAELLAAVDLFLAPFLDGVSTRRTSMMAALQHGLPVLGTDGRLTDDVLRDARGALRLVSTTDQTGFAAAAVALAGDDEVRAKLGVAGRLLYEEQFDWPVLATRFVEIVTP
jgi:glycosyltransferase involved in cell wall biosynthesis